jgi:flagellar hook-length control protein FliK
MGELLEVISTESGKEIPSQTVKAGISIAENIWTPERSSLTTEVAAEPDSEALKSINPNDFLKSRAAGLEVITSTGSNSNINAHINKEINRKAEEGGKTTGISVEKEENLSEEESVKIEPEDHKRGETLKRLPQEETSAEDGAEIFAKDNSADDSMANTGKKAESSDIKEPESAGKTENSPNLTAKTDSAPKPASVEKTFEWQSPKDAVKFAKLVQQAWEGGISKLTVRLVPEHLGKIEIQLTEINGRLDAKILANSMESKNFLAASADAITKQLTEKGITIDNMDFAFHDSLAKDTLPKDSREKSARERESRVNKIRVTRNAELKEEVGEKVYA